MKSCEFNWNKFSFFQSTSWVQNYLLKCYENLDIQSPDTKSFENCYPFIYYLEHGEKYYKLSKQAPTELKPVLLFYGMIQLIKASLLTVDPAYPESTSVLSHGASTRKRKKKNYDFLNDEIKVQKYGLFTHFSNKIFSIKELEGDKIKMINLLKRVPEMNEPFEQFLHKPFLVVANTDNTKNSYYINIKLLDHLHMTLDRFTDFFKSYCPVSAIITQQNNRIEMKLPKEIDYNKGYPIFISQSGDIHLPLERTLYPTFPELMAHYLLLYNLSMICRYETEWWNDLIHTRSSNDYPLILNFISITENKVPFLIYQFLSQKIGNPS